MLNKCTEYAAQHCLTFNVAKTQLIRFLTLIPSLMTQLSYFFFLVRNLSIITMLFILAIFWVVIDLTMQTLLPRNRTFANYMLSVFSSCDPLTKTRLLQSCCLSLYGAALWNSFSCELASLEVVFNNILRKIWKLPHHCHTGIFASSGQHAQHF